MNVVAGDREVTYIIDGDEWTTWTRPGDDKPYLIWCAGVDEKRRAPTEDELARIAADATYLGGMITMTNLDFEERGFGVGVSDVDTPPVTTSEELSRDLPMPPTWMDGSPPQKISWAELQEVRAKNPEAFDAEVKRRADRIAAGLDMDGKDSGYTVTLKQDD